MSIAMRMIRLLFTSLAICPFTVVLTTAPPHQRGSGASEVVTVPGWPSLSGKFPLSFGIKTDDMVYASGIQGMDMQTMKLVKGGVGPETKQILLNLKSLLQAAGSSLQDVVQCSVSLVNVSRDFGDMNKAYAEAWPQDPPARVAVQVAALAGDSSVEIQCDAAITGRGRKVVTVPGFPDLTKKGFPLSYATVANGMIYLSGSQGMDMKTGKLVLGGVANETTQTLKNLEQVLKAAGSSADRVVGCSVSLKNMSDFAKMNEAYKAFWPNGGALGGLPTRVCVQVASLAGSAAVEIQCTAASPGLPSDKSPKIVKVPGMPDIPLPFSAGVTSGGMVYVSGNQGIDMHTKKLVAGGVFNETSQTIKNIKDVVEAAGATLADVTSCEVSLKDMKDFAEMNKAYQVFWESDPPSRVAVNVAALAGEARVEIRCAAALPRKVQHAMFVV